MVDLPESTWLLSDSQWLNSSMHLSNRWWKHVPLSPTVSMMSTDKGMRSERDLQ